MPPNPSQQLSEPALDKLRLRAKNTFPACTCDAISFIAVPNFFASITSENAKERLKLFRFIRLSDDTIKKAQAGAKKGQDLSLSAHVGAEPKDEAASIPGNMKPGAASVPAPQSDTNHSTWQEIIRMAHNPFHPHSELEPSTCSISLDIAVQPCRCR